MSESASRAFKLSKQLNDILSGKQPLSKHNNGLFIEAICSISDRPACVHKLLQGTHGLNSLQSSFRFDLSVTFFNGNATKLLNYFSASEISEIGGGTLLRRILLCIVEPAIFWSAFKSSFHAGELQADAQLAFAWLLHQLLLLPGEESAPYIQAVQEEDTVQRLLLSSTNDVRSIAYKVQHIVSSRTVNIGLDSGVTPGGRHDNDFADFRKITILPTTDELLSKELPFLRRSSDVKTTCADLNSNPITTHLDNQFRLLREDMLYEIREELQEFLGGKKLRKKQRGCNVNGLIIERIHTQTSKDKDAGKHSKWGLAVRCRDDPFKAIKPKSRKSYFEDNRRLFSHQSIACLIADDECVAFSSINRDMDLLCQVPPIIVLQFDDEKSIRRAMLKIRSTSNAKLLQIDAPVFAYEPILKALQEKHGILLSDELMCWTSGAVLRAPLHAPTSVIDAIQACSGQNLQQLLKSSTKINLDDAQLASLISGLSQRLSLIQGPPGTGKSYIGSILAKIMHDFTEQTVLVVCYTNHALDQFLEDLISIGVPKAHMVRLGSKSTSKTEDLALRKQPRRSRLGRHDWDRINPLKMEADELSDSLVRTFQEFQQSNPLRRLKSLLEHLEFQHPEYYEAFCVPEATDDMMRVGAKGKNITPTYLVEQWIKGKGPGTFARAENVRNAARIWAMDSATRQNQANQWTEELFAEIAERLSGVGKKYNDCLTELKQIFEGGDAAILKSKRIIACTTTGAAMYREQIKTAKAGVVLVEEAGEILESHILTALGAETDHLILIGDHKQLRPKVNHYLLTVEKGEGFDLNRSLFERLVLEGYPHVVLRMQHRMRPQISNLVRQLTYPELEDAPRTQGRPNVMGLRDNIVFINHSHPEDDFSDLHERRDPSVKSSKQNQYEVDMILKTVRYLAQQGYGTDSLVVLTPYLGQLRQLREALKRDNDPVLSDLDSHDLLLAGMLSPSAAKISKKSLRLATIDNYQGEESDIVIVSMTRSNPNHDIGFMASHERQTVLLSRARNGLIMFGNADTFLYSRKGSEVWKPLFDILKRDGHIYDGLPVRCERHPSREALLTGSDDFDEKCPEGGCTEPCPAILSCGVHACPSKCHQISDHSKMNCEFPVYQSCPTGHLQQWICRHGTPSTCNTCESVRMELARKQKEDFEHATKIAALEVEISRQQRLVQAASLREERTRAIEQKKRDLKDAAALASIISTATSNEQSNKFPTTQAAPNLATCDSTSDGTVSNMPPSAEHKPSTSSAAKSEWERRKQISGESNDSMDKLMDMIGLEDVKRQWLGLKDKIDTAIRQGSSLKEERFNASFLGNPGTGKTTVARLYGKFMSSVQVIPGNMFVETTGARIGLDGIAGIKKQIEQVLNAGGGTIFIDEAYQLTSQNNPQGAQALDYLLTEMENNVGKVVFIFAGYSREMEKFFEHNPGLPSRVPNTLRFRDYDDVQLLEMLGQQIDRAWKGRMKIDDTEGIRGLYGRIAVRRLGRGRSSPGFGNARALANMFAKIRERQSERISAERNKGRQPSDFLLTKEDLIGPNPTSVMKESAAWKRLQSMIGLASVKESIANMFSMMETNYQRELKELVPFQVSLNRVFLGSPGTGKTSVAKLYGQILADLGLVSSGEVVVKNPADFIGAFIGHSESQTKAILAATVGKVLIIDEAYMLYGRGGGGDSFKTAVIDTIVAEVQSVPGEDRCVLLLGYKHQIEEMFQNVNPGLSRRFAMENAFHFHDYSDAELLQALEWKLKDQDILASDAAKLVAMQVLTRARNRPNFGNIGEVENLLGIAKNRYQKRQSALPAKERRADAPFEPTDFDPDHDRDDRASSNLAKLFEDVTGCEDIISKLNSWQKIARNAKARGKDPRSVIPTNFIFKGPPGTGKTTTARKMGAVYYDMGFLSSTEVIESSATDLVGQYVGHTGPKTQKLFEKALGKVLFIDEAYRLSEGRFATEAMDEMVGLLTKEEYKGRLIVILAGYDQEMNRLLATNPGLHSRFPEEIIFNNMPPEQCLSVLKQKLRKQSIRVPDLDDPSSSEYKRMSALLMNLSQLPAWGNARDVETMAKQLVGVALESFASPVSDNLDDSITLPATEAVRCIEDMLRSRTSRLSNVPTRRDFPKGDVELQKAPGSQDAPPSQEPPTAHHNAAAPLSRNKDASVPIVSKDGRDAGVSDEVWNQLEVDKGLAAESAEKVQEAKEKIDGDLREATAQEEAAIAAERELAQRKAKTDAERDEIMRKREEERLWRLKANLERAKAEAARREIERKQQEEARVQSKLRKMGVCVAGYHWIKQASGYRCAGGSHFIGNDKLRI